MKKISGYVSIRPLGCYDFEFYVSDDTTDEEIEQKIDDICELDLHYKIEGGYIAEQTTTYRKKYDDE